MKRKLFKTTVLSALYLAAVGFAGSSLANGPFSGTLAGETSAGAGDASLRVDDFTVPCNAPGISNVTITNNSGQGNVKVSVGRINVSGAGVSAVDALGGGSSPAISLLGGAATYDIAVSHNSTISTNTYTVNFTCSGVATQIINQ